MAKTFLEDIIKKHYGEDRVGDILPYHNPNAYIQQEGGYEKFFLSAENEEVNDKTIYIGAELEMGLTQRHPSSEIKALLKKLMEKVPCILEHDSSINNGRTYEDCEIITQPMTPKKWLTLGPDIKEIFKELADFGWQSHNLGTCGLHFHYTIIDYDHKAEIVNRMWEQIHTWENETHKIAGRGYVNFAHDLDCHDAIVPEEKLSMDYINEKVIQNGREHSSVINLQHEHDIEIRISRGTLNFDTFMARLEYFYNLYVQANQLNIIVQRMTWGKLIKGKYIKSYVDSHSITTNKKCYDYSSKIGKYKNDLSRYDDKLITQMMLTLKDLKTQLQSGKPRELCVIDEVTATIQNISSALSTLTTKYINVTSLKNHLTRMRDSGWYWDSTNAKTYMLEHTNALHELLQKRPTITLNSDTQASEV